MNTTYCIVRKILVKNELNLKRNLMAYPIKLPICMFLIVPLKCKSHGLETEVCVDSAFVCVNIFCLASVQCLGSGHLGLVAC